MWQLKVSDTLYKELKFECKHLDDAMDLIGRMKKSATCSLKYELMYVYVEEATMEEGEE